jgi:hypothetical protein
MGKYIKDQFAETVSATEFDPVALAVIESDGLDGGKAFHCPS